MKSRFSRIALFAAVLVAIPTLVPGSAFGCIWDSDTLQDELQSRSSAFHVITGQVPQHGDAYYAKRLDRSRALLKQAPESLEVLYDAAGAEMRLDRPEAAIRHLEAAAKVEPGRYKTESNLGVAHFLRAQKAENPEAGLAGYATALAHTNRALEKRPGGHFDAGWLFARMVAWKQAAAKAEGGTPALTMMGGAYKNRWKSSVRNAASKRAKAAGTKLEKDFDGIKPMLTLLRAYPDFAEGYFVLGVNLHNEWNLNLALWAYVRALDLGHPNTKAIHKHIDDIFGHWKDLLKNRQQRSGQTLMSKADSIAAIRKELKLASAWLPAFQKTEARMIAKSEALPDIETVMRVLEGLGVARRVPRAVGLVGGTSRMRHGPAEGGLKLESKAKRSSPKQTGAKKAAKEEVQGPANDAQPPVGGRR